MSKAYYKGWQEGGKCFRLVGKHSTPANPYPSKSSERQEFYLGVCDCLESLSNAIKLKENEPKTIR